MFIKIIMPNKDEEIVINSDFIIAITTSGSAYNYYIQIHLSAPLIRHEKVKIELNFEGDMESRDRKYESLNSLLSAKYL